MGMRSLMVVLVACLVGGVTADSSAAEVLSRPNIIVILADDLGFGEVGCYGQTVIQTPRLDQMAAEGMRFTHFYAGATVCAPSRSVLMTGQHHGHTRVRGNAGRTNPSAQALLDEDVTVAEVLSAAGYRTALFGKWGLGDVGEAETGLPRKQGFDEFYGYLSQHRAHNHFPDYLWENETKVALKNVVEPVGEFGGGYATEQVEFADDLFAERCLSLSAVMTLLPSSSTGAWWCPMPTMSERVRLGMGRTCPTLGRMPTRTGRSKIRDMPR